MDKIYFGGCGGTRTLDQSGMNRTLYQLSYTAISYGGAKEIRTLDPLNANQVLSQLSYSPITLKNGRDGRIRTCDPLLPKQMHYQAVLHPDLLMARLTGLEPVTLRFVV